MPDRPSPADPAAPAPPVAEDAAPRILEIGEIGLFHMGMPARTDAYFASYRADMRRGRRFLGLSALWRIAHRVRRGDYALVVLHPPFYPGWHYRSFLAAFKFTLFRGRPAGLYGALASPLVFELLRFVRLPNLIAVDRSDSFSIPRHHFFLLDMARAFFKRELPIDHWQALHGTAHRRLPGATFRRRRRWRRRMAKVRPIALGVTADVAAQAAAMFGCEKKTDVFFAGAIEANSVARLEVPRLIARLAAAGVRVDAPEHALAFSEYIRRCGEAWLTLSPAGLGWDCYRHVEAALAGSVPLISQPSIHRYRPLIIGTHCLVYYSDEDNAVEVVTEALKDKHRLSDMARRAHEHARANLTVEAICQHLLEEYAARD